MTTIAWDSDISSDDYSVSQIRKWLNTEFLPTLYDADNLLVNATWDYTAYNSFPTNKLDTTNSVTERVGLLNIYEYKMTGGTDSESTLEIFLNNGYNWWTISPLGDASGIWHVNNTNYIECFYFESAYGVRPSVSLKSSVNLLDGTGKKNNPYTLKVDKATGTSSELLSNRISGEYIKFNNTKYRIVGIEEIEGKTLTKVTMADYSKNANSIGTSVFGLDFKESTYSPTYGIGLYLEEWYQADDTNTTYASTYINDTYKRMIATNEDDDVKWYSGATYLTDDYALAKTGTEVSATIGIGYYGEMFSSHSDDGDGSSTSIWLITRNSSSTAMFPQLFISNKGDVYNASLSIVYSVRPSFYLKDDVKIKSGAGMPHAPYEIFQ